METSSYLFMSKRKRLLISSRIMEKRSSSDSNISRDSLEENGKTKFITKDGASDDNVDTILVPFYENDVLIKVPKGQKRNQKNKYGKQNEKLKKEWPQPNYLVNKGRIKQTTYLDMFRKQFSSSQPVERESEEYEISSLLPEYGDTEIESIGEEVNNPGTEFFNTEPYNEMYYEKLLNKEISYYLDNSCEEGIRFTEDIRSKTPDETDENNLRSISEVTQQLRPSRRGTALPIPNVKLGGLGPDIEKIKPRLERARSLQRYSEKVRMENRLKIYKKSIQADDKKVETETSARRRDSTKEGNKDTIIEQNASYLINKTQEPKMSKITKKMYEAKSKSADLQRIKERCREKEKRTKDKSQSKKNENPGNSQNQTQKHSVVQEIRPKKVTEKDERKAQRETETRVRAKSNSRSKGINTELNKTGVDVPPVQISFLVNVGGMRPSSALRNLEEKHRMYQDQVKAFTMDRNDI